MNAVQLAVLVIRLLGAWSLLEAIDMTTYMPALATRLHYNTRGYWHLILSLEWDMLVVRVFLHTAVGFLLLFAWRKVGKFLVVGCGPESQA